MLNLGAISSLVSLSDHTMRSTSNEAETALSEEAVRWIRGRAPRRCTSTHRCGGHGYGVEKWYGAHARPAPEPFRRRGAAYTDAAASAARRVRSRSLPQG